MGPPLTSNNAGSPLFNLPQNAGPAPFNAGSMNPATAIKPVGGIMSPPLQSTMEAPLEHLTSEHRKTPELMDPSGTTRSYDPPHYDPYTGLEYLSFPNSPTAIVDAIGRKFFLFASDPASVLDS